ncbi:14023_t:CDS:2 [Entrophospora sp. SA101]|nr:14023_t:CDS:2 [Entrophospora sp. SA101]
MFWLFFSFILRNKKLYNNNIPYDSDYIRPNNIYKNRLHGNGGNDYRNTRRHDEIRYHEIIRHDDGLQQSYKRPSLSHSRSKSDNKYSTYYYPRSRSPSYHRSIDYIRKQSLSPSSILKHGFDDYSKNHKSLTTTPSTKMSTTSLKKKDLELDIIKKSAKKRSENYNQILLEPSIRIEEPPPMLIVLDLNGTLVYRDGEHRLIHLRPHISAFKNFLFRNKNFNIMIWSSAQRINVNRMAKEIFGNGYGEILLEIWSRDKFNLTNEEYHSKCLTIKDLEMVWNELNTSMNKNTIQSSNSERKPSPFIPPPHSSLSLQSSSILWDQTNTVLIDDSPLKAQLQPHNAIHLKEFNRELFCDGNDSELLNIIEYLELLKCQSNISHFIKNHPYDSNQNYVNYYQNEINIESVSDNTKIVANNYYEEGNEGIIELDLDEEDL